MMKALRFDEVRMARALTAGFLNATELADYLVTKGIPFREAHHITGSAVALAEGKNLSLEALPLDALQGLCDRIGPDVFDVLEYRAAVARRNAPGGTRPGHFFCPLTAQKRKALIRSCPLFPLIPIDRIMDWRHPSRELSNNPFDKRLYAGHASRTKA